MIGQYVYAKLRIGWWTDTAPQPLVAACPVLGSPLAGLARPGAPTHPSTLPPPPSCRTISGSMATRALGVFKGRAICIAHAPPPCPGAPGHPGEGGGAPPCPFVVVAFCPMVPYFV